MTTQPRLARRWARVARPVCCGRRGFWDGSQLRDGPVVAGPDGPLRRRHRPPGADGTNTDLAKATATDGNTNDHDLGGSGAGAVAIGLAVGLGAPAWVSPGSFRFDRGRYRFRFQP